MSYSEVDICNIALARCGVSNTIASLTEQSKEARLCRRFYNFARDDVLERALWPGFVRIVALAPLAEADLIPGWGYQYALPSDAATIDSVIPAGDVGAVSGTLGALSQDCCGPWLPGRFGRQSYRKALSADGTRMAILANVEDAYAVYGARVTNPGLFSNLMVSVIADRLMMEIAVPLTADPRWLQVAQQRFAAAFMEAATREFDQGDDLPDRVPPSIRARY